MMRLLDAVFHAGADVSAGLAVFWQFGDRPPVNYTKMLRLAGLL
jgi:hypothetical protein